MEPKNKNRRNVDCLTDDFFPEVCYPKNDPFWDRLTVCDEKGDPCDLDLSGLRQPNATPSRPDEGNDGATVGNNLVELSCPEPYQGPGPNDVTVSVPANQFVRFIADARDTQAIAEAQIFVDALATVFAQTQLTCFAYNETQTRACPPTNTPENGGENNLIDAQDVTTETNVLSGEIKVRLQGVTVVVSQEERKALTNNDLKIGNYVAQLDKLSPNYYEVTGFDGDNFAIFAPPVDSVTAYASLHEQDLNAANAAAVNKAYANLDCYYGNPEVTVNCPTDPQGVAAQGNATVTVAADSLNYKILDLESGGPYPTLPDQSELPTLEDQAKTLGVSQLRCVWFNQPVSVDCPTVATTKTECSDVDETPGEVSNASACETNDTLRTVFSDEVTTPDQFWDRSPVRSFTVESELETSSVTPLSPSSVTVDSGQFQSVLTFTPEQAAAPDDLVFAGQSQAELTGEALLLAQSQLQCRYGNNGYLGKASCCPDQSIIPDIQFVEQNLNTCEAGTVTDPIEYYPDYAEDPISFNATNTTALYKRTVIEPKNPPSSGNGWPTSDAIENDVALDANTIVLAVSADGEALDTIGTNTYRLNETTAQETKDAADELALDIVCQAFALCFWGNDELAPAYCEPKNPDIEPDTPGVEGEAQLYTEESKPSETIPENTIVSPEGKFQAQVLAVTVALASRVCVPKQAGNIHVELDCPEPTTTPDNDKYGVFVEEASIKPVIEADTYFANTECEATQLALDIAEAQRLCAYTNFEVTTGDCPADLVPQHTPIELPEGTIFDYLPNSTPTATAQILANSVRVCTTAENDQDSPFSDACHLVLSGNVTLDSEGVPDPTTITWNVTSGYAKKAGQSDDSDAAEFAGASGSYVPEKPYFYLLFDVNNDDETVGGAVAVEQYSAQVTRDYVRSPSLPNKGILYIGRFVGYERSLDGTTYTGNIIVADTLCAPEPTDAYKYLMPKATKYEWYPNESRTSDPSTSLVTFGDGYVHDAINGGQFIIHDPGNWNYAADDIWYITVDLDGDGNLTGVGSFNKAGPAGMPANSPDAAHFLIATYKGKEEGFVMARSAGIVWFGAPDNSHPSPSSSSSSSEEGSLPPPFSSSSVVASSSNNESFGSLTSASNNESFGSSKDTAIVAAPWLGKDAYTALFVEEQPEVIFSDHFDTPITKRESKFKLDARFFDVCAPNTIKITGLVADRPGSVGAEILEDSREIIIRVGWFSKIKRVTGRISGVRKGFDGLRLPPKTREDFENNETWLKR